MDQSGFQHFIPTLAETHNDHAQLVALAERWWDTTNTFHLPFGEATLTPLDFAAITGIRVGGDPLPLDDDLFRNHDALIHYLGRVPRMNERGIMRYGHLYKDYQGFVCDTEQSFGQLARVFLLYLLGVSLFATKDNRISLRFLPALRDLYRVHTYDWGGAALATIYGHMGHISRSSESTLSMGGYWRIWEVYHFRTPCFIHLLSSYIHLRLLICQSVLLQLWAYEFLGMRLPENTYADAEVIPRALRWARSTRGTKVGGKSLDRDRLFLNRLTENRVRCVSLLSLSA